MLRKQGGVIAPLVVGVLLLFLAPSASASIRFVTQWGSEGTGNGQFQSPYGVATDSSDNVYVIEYDGARVDKFSSSGSFITKWGSSGSGAGQFTHAEDIAVGASDHVYVADTGNDRVQEFTSSGSFVRQWGGSGTGDGQFEGPSGIATDSAGNVYVTDDADLGRVQKFDPSGSFLTEWNNIGLNDLEITVDSAGYFYVGGWYVHIHGRDDLIQKYDPSGNYVATLGGSRGTTDLATDPSDRVFAAGGGVREYNSSGQFITTWGPGLGSGVATNSVGRIFVADATNNRIQVFRQSTEVPETTVTSGPQGTIHDSTPTFRFSSVDLDATFACKLDSGDYKSCSSPRTPTPLADGPHTFSVRATDPNGTDPSPAVRSFTVEATDATTVAVSGSTLVVNAARGVSNNIRIDRAIRVRDVAGADYVPPPGRYSGSVVEAGAHCKRTGVSSVTCPARLVTRIRVMAKDKGDAIFNGTTLPSAQSGGAGGDSLAGGSGNDTVTAGPGGDFVNGNGGNDLILARDGANDRVNCGEGHHDRAELDRLPLDSGARYCETKTRR
jgi:hypothetical protein